MPARSADVTHKVRLYWDSGVVEIDLFGETSPRHVANFLRYVDEGLYDNTYPHRSRSGSARFIQGGSFYVPDPLTLLGLDDNRIPTFLPVKNEFDASNGLSNTARTLAAARTSNPDSATSGWFFNVTDNSAGFDPGPFTVFGEVTSGWDTFSALPFQPTINQLFAPGTYPPVVSTTPLNNIGTMEIPVWDISVFQEWVRIPTTPGDFNLDGLVDNADFAVWSEAQGAIGVASNLTADADGDGDVDLADVQVWQDNLGNGTLKDLLGDYNGNGVVGEADYLWWRTTFGSSATLDADGNGDGRVNAADYTLWRDRLGTGSSASILAEGTTVPEPSTGLLALLAGVAATLVWRRKLP